MKGRAACYCAHVMGFGASTLVPGLSVRSLRERWSGTVDIDWDERLVRVARSGGVRSDMTTDAPGPESLSVALDRVENAVTKHPSLGIGTEHSISTVTRGLRCTSEEGAFRFETDLPETMGGEGSGPSPGVLGRAALGSCLAMGYQMRAARLGVDLATVSVEIEADFDVVGMLSMEAAARPGYSEVRYHVSVESSAPEADILRVLDEGDMLSPYRDVFSAETPMKRTVSIQSPTA